MLPLLMISQGILIDCPRRTDRSLPLFTIRGVGTVGGFKKYFLIWSDSCWDKPEKENHEYFNGKLRSAINYLL